MVMDLAEMDALGRAMSWKDSLPTGVLKFLMAANLARQETLTRELQITEEEYEALARQVSRQENPNVGLKI